MKKKRDYVVNERPFILVGTTYNEFCLWCEIHGEKPWQKTSKVKFFSRIREGRITRSIYGYLYEDGKILSLDKEKK